MHHAGQQALQQLLLSKDDRGLVLEAPRQVVEALGRLPLADEPDEEERAPREERSRDREYRRQCERAGECLYTPCAFLNSAVIAGTISCRSPITA
jgi:hypothetical protein